MLEPLPSTAHSTQSVCGTSWVKTSQKILCLAICSSKGLSGQDIHKKAPSHSHTHTHTNTLFLFFKQETQLSMWWVTKSQQRLSCIFFFLILLKIKRRRKKKSSVKTNSWVQMVQHNWKTWLFSGDSGQHSLVTDSVRKVKLYGTWKLFRSLGKVLKPNKPNKATTTTKHTKKLIFYKDRMQAHDISRHNSFQMC